MILGWNEFVVVPARVAVEVLCACQDFISFLEFDFMYEFVTILF